RGRAVPGGGGAGQVVVPEQDRDHARHVEAGLAAGQTTAEVQVGDVARVELRHLVERGADDRRRQVVGAASGEGSLEGAADAGAGGGDDNGVVRVECGHAAHVTYELTEPILAIMRLDVHDRRDHDDSLMIAAGGLPGVSP